VDEFPHRGRSPGGPTELRGDGHDLDHRIVSGMLFGLYLLASQLEKKTPASDQSTVTNSWIPEWVRVAFFIWGVVSAVAFFWSLGYHAWLELSGS
jgi:hypothetical protein